MKKKLLALALVATGLTKAQTILLSQDFSTASPPSLPSGWLQNNLDGLTPSTSIATFSFGTNAWVSANLSTTYPTYGKVGASTSWYSPAGIANDWLISPQFSVSAGVYLEWEAVVADISFPDGYVVLVSPTGGTATTAFTSSVLTITAENDTWTSRSVNLSAFAGQNIRVAFVNNSNDMDRLFLDNIKALIPAASDGAVTTLTSVPRYVATGNVSIGGVFKNNGSSTVNNASMSYQVDNGPVTSQTISFAGLTYAQTAAYAFTAPTNLVAGPHTVKAWVSATNGVNEINKTNDTARTVVYVATQVRPRNALVEEFTSSTCVPCANLNVTFDPLLNGNAPNTGGQVNVIKYQMNWPSPGTDPSYNPHGNKRRGFYGVNAIPDAFTNGVNNMQSHNQAEINAAKAEPAWADMTAFVSVSGANVSASATITPYVTVNGPVRAFQVLMQQFYNFPGASTTQKNYYHAMRIMNPSGAGVPTPVNAGTPFNLTFNHTATTVATPAQNSFNFWTANPTVGYEYVVFLQDTVSKHILNSASAQFTLSTVGLVKLEKNTNIGVYPNPANKAATIAVKVEESTNVDITIIDITGKIVYTKEKEVLVLGQNEITVDTEKFATGTYNVVVKMGDKTSTTKLVVEK
jgi:hypothetical protein